MRRIRASTEANSFAVGLVEQHDVSEPKLLLRLRRAIELAEQVFCVRNRDDGIELRLAADVFIDKEGLRHRRRIGEPGGFNDDAVHPYAPPHEAAENADEIAAHSAADAAVVHLEDFFFGIDDQVVVDTDLAEFIDDDGIALAVGLGEDSVQQRRLPGTEITGDDRDRVWFAAGCIGRVLLLMLKTSASWPTSMRERRAMVIAISM
jgi:hypothetical protein